MAQETDPAAAEARQNQAVKEVQYTSFDFDVVTRPVNAKYNVDTKISKRADRRESLLPSTKEAQTATLGEDGDADLIELHTYDDYCRTAPQELPLDERYLENAASLADDLKARIETLASRQAGKDNGPTFHFSPLSQSGKIAFAGFNSGLDFEAFQKRVQENPKAMFDEVKLRAHALVASRLQAADLHARAQQLDVNQVILNDWVHYMGGQLKDAEKDAEENGPLINTEQVEKLMEKVEDLEQRLADATPPEGEMSRPDLLTRVAEQDGEIDILHDTVRDLGEKLSTADAKLVTANKAIEDLRNQRQGTPGTEYTAGGTKKSTKIDGPSIFTNNPTEDKMDFEFWYSSMKTKLSVNADHYPSEEAKMLAIQSKLGGSAATNLMPYIRESNKQRLKTAKAMLEHLWDEYYDHNKTKKAEVEFSKLHMENFKDFMTFKNEFVRQAGESGEPQDRWKSLLERKLPNRVKNALVLQFLDDTVDFQKICKLCQQVDLTYKLSSMLKDDGKPKNSGTNSGTSGGGRNQGRGGGNSNRNGGGSRNTGGSGGGGDANRKKPHERDWAKGRLTPEEVVRYVSENRCFNCREQGHQSRRCPVPRPGYTKSTMAELSEIAKRFGYDTSPYQEAAPTSTRAGLDAESENE